MGCSCSHEKFQSHGKDRPSTNKQKSSHYTNFQADPSRRFLQVKSALLGVIASHSSEYLCNWKKIKSELDQYILTFSKDTDLQWPISFYSTQSPTLPTNAGSLLSVEEVCKEPEADKELDEKSEIYLSFSDVPDASQMIKTKLSHKDQQKESDRSTIILTESKMHSYFNPIQELKTKFEKKFKKGDFIFELVKVFSRCWKELFSVKIQDLRQQNWANQHEKVSSNLIHIVKRFILILTNFLHQIHQEQLKPFEEELDHYDYDPYYLIENIVFQLVFKEFDLKKAVIEILSLRYQEDTRKFKQVVLNKKSENLESYDSEVLPRKRNFLLESEAIPYERVIKKLRTLPRETNPYAQIELIDQVFQEDTWSCISTHFETQKNSAETLKTMKKSFGMEILIPIIVYSLVQSQCEELIAERRFIEEFIDPQYAELSLGLKAFMGCIDYLTRNEEGGEREEV